MTLMTVTYIDVDTGTEWGGEPSATAYPSAAAAVASLKQRDTKHMFCDGYLLDFSRVDYLGILIRTEFIDRAD